MAHVTLRLGHLSKEPLHLCLRGELVSEALHRMITSLRQLPHRSRRWVKAIFHRAGLDLFIDVLSASIARWRTYVQARRMVRVVIDTPRVLDCLELAFATVRLPTIKGPVQKVVIGIIWRALLHSIG